LAAFRQPEQGAVRPTLPVDADDVVDFKFVRYGAVANAGDHGGHSLAQFHKVLRADRIIETLAKGDIAEFDAVTDRVGGHAQWTIK